MTKFKQIINKILSILLDFLLIIVFVIIMFGLYYMFQIKALKNEYANMFGYTFFEVATGSMANTINIGDVVIVKITKDVNENDIIVYKEENSFITHRLIKKTEDKLIAKGDANNSEDKPIVYEQILGEVTYIIPQIGTLRKAIMTPQVLGLTSVVIILLGIVFMHNSKTEEENNG